MHIPLVISFTPNYIIPAAVLIQSVLNSSHADDFFEVICLLTKPITAEMKDALESLDSRRLKFKYINLDGALAGYHINERYTIAASYRLLLPEILTDYDKTIYLDCDIVVRQNIAKLYRDTVLNDNYFAGVYEAILDSQIQYLESVGCKVGEYINSGFLIINLKKLREEHVMNKLLEASNNPNLNFPDQDAINMVSKGKILGLPPVYNAIRTYFLPQHKKEFLRLYTEEDWNVIQKNGNIHYTGEKPWNAYTVEFDKWWAINLRLPSQFRKNFGIGGNGKIYMLYLMYRLKPFQILFRIMQSAYRGIRK